jgi:hypothetical protein
VPRAVRCGAVRGGSGGRWGICAAAEMAVAASEY